MSFLLWCFLLSLWALFTNWINCLLQFARLEDARNAQSLNGQLEIGGRTIKVLVLLVILILCSLRIWVMEGLFQLTWLYIYKAWLLELCYTKLSVIVSQGWWNCSPILTVFRFQCMIVIWAWLILSFVNYWKLLIVFTKCILCCFIMTCDLC